MWALKKERPKQSRDMKNGKEFIDIYKFYIGMYTITEHV